MPNTYGWARTPVPRHHWWVGTIADTGIDNTHRYSIEQHSSNYRPRGIPPA